MARRSPVRPDLGQGLQRAVPTSSITPLPNRLHTVKGNPRCAAGQISGGPGASAGILPAVWAGGGTIPSAPRKNPRLG